MKQMHGNGEDRQGNKGNRLVGQELTCIRHCTHAFCSPELTQISQQTSEAGAAAIMLK